MARKGLSDWLQEFGLVAEGEAILRGPGTDDAKAEQLTSLLQTAGAVNLTVSKSQVYRWRQAAGVEAAARETKAAAVTNQPRPRGAPRGNRNAVVHGVYAKLLADAGLGEAQWAVLTAHEELPTMDAIEAELRTLYIQRSMGIRFVGSLTGLPGEMVVKLASSTSGSNGMGNFDQSTSVSEPTREAVLRTFAALDRTQARITNLLRLKAQIERKLEEDEEDGRGGLTVVMAIPEGTRYEGD